MSPQAPTNPRKRPPTGPGSTSLGPGGAPTLTATRKSCTQSVAAGASLEPAAELPAAAVDAAAAAAVGQENGSYGVREI